MVGDGSGPGLGEKRKGSSIGTQHSVITLRDPDQLDEVRE